jgi:hypothetical protein
MCRKATFTLFQGLLAGKKGSAAVSEDSLLERVTAAAEERQLSQNSLIGYRCTWLKIIAWAAAEGCR